jgi:hypothetical protein
LDARQGGNDPENAQRGVRLLRSNVQGLLRDGPVAGPAERSIHGQPRMKSLPIVLSVLATPQRRRNLLVLGWLLAVFVVIVVMFSAAFHYLMALEGRDFSWATGVYWTLTVMSTLGFGDITFESDLGRMFSVVVLLTGTVFMLVLLPFMFIQFFYVPCRRETSFGAELQRVVEAPDAGPHASTTQQRWATTDTSKRHRRELEHGIGLAHRSQFRPAKTCRGCIARTHDDIRKLACVIGSHRPDRCGRVEPERLLERDQSPSFSSAVSRECPIWISSSDSARL